MLVAQWYSCWVSYTLSSASNMSVCVCWKKVFLRSVLHLCSSHFLFLLLLPFAPSLSLSLFFASEWNCGGGQLGRCRWPSLLPWWCSALTQCPLATVTIGDRQVHQVLHWTPLPTSREVNYTVTTEVQHMFSLPVADWAIPALEEGVERGQFALSLSMTECNLDKPSFWAGMQTHPFEWSSLNRYKWHLSCQQLSTQIDQCGCDLIYSDWMQTFSSSGLMLLFSSCLILSGLL